MICARGISDIVAKPFPRPIPCQGTATYVSTMPTTRSAQEMIETGPRIRAAYSEGAGIYRIVPAGVAHPAGVAELQGLVAWARECGGALVARGAGSGIPGNAVGQGVIVDLRERMPRVLEVDPVTSTAVTSANVTQADLNRIAHTHGL